MLISARLCKKERLVFFILTFSIIIVRPRLLSLKCKLRHSDIIYRKKIHTSWYLEAFLALLKIKTAKQFCEKSRLQNAHNQKPGKFEGSFTTPYNEYKI